MVLSGSWKEFILSCEKEVGTWPHWAKRNTMAEVNKAMTSPTATQFKHDRLGATDKETSEKRRTALVVAKS